MGMFSRAIILILALVFSFLDGKNAQDLIFPALFTFGDSAMDIGNNNYLPTIFKANYLPYGRDFANHKPTGRFCNGKLVSDIAADTLGFKSYIPPYLSPAASGKNLLHGASFASAGSGYDDKAAVRSNALTLPQQLQYFKEYQSKLAKVAGANRSAFIIKEGLCLLSSGTADLLVNYYVNGRLNKAYTPDQYISFLIRGFSRFVKGLYALGARRLGVSALLPIGCTPAARDLFGSNEIGCVSRINNDALNFNKKINSTSAALKKQLPGLKIAVFDIFTSIHDLVKSPLHHGFVEARRGCCMTGTTHVATKPLLCNPKYAGTCSNASQYVFWDGTHPSEAVNHIIAESLLFQGFSLI
ncbi:GDSL esterase/lipase APG-like [Mercurialis annua]|uniref:GDSL esterase/lipase APG-like n=1 Tax=Mercurialis annua TaxID=3986 RepID=UPI00215F3404|nr:GDSL esterase/lipase APG-like [Mercurialis annua]